MTQFKYEAVAEVGDRIRSYDFAYKNDHIEGKVIRKDTEGRERGFAAFVVEADTCTWGNRVGATVYVPMESLFDWDDRVVNLSRSTVAL